MIWIIFIDSCKTKNPVPSLVIMIEKNRWNVIKCENFWKWNFSKRHWNYFKISIVHLLVKQRESWLEALSLATLWSLYIILYRHWYLYIAYVLFYSCMVRLFLFRHTFTIYLFLSSSLSPPLCAKSHNVIVVSCLFRDMFESPSVQNTPHNVCV